jgi:hypothetical protein
MSPHGPSLPTLRGAASRRLSEVHRQWCRHRRRGSAPDPSLSLVGALYAAASGLPW